MNIDTGKIEMLPPMSAEHAYLARMFEIEEAEMTAKQVYTLQVSPYDHRSPLGKKLTAIRRDERTKYKRHMGAKELAKRAARLAQNH